MVMVGPVLPVCGCVDKYSRVKLESGELLVVEGGRVREAIPSGLFLSPTLESALRFGPDSGTNLSLTAVGVDMCLTDGWCSAAWGLYSSVFRKHHHVFL